MAILHPDIYAVIASRKEAAGQEPVSKAIQRQYFPKGKPQEPTAPPRPTAPPSAETPAEKPGSEAWLAKRDFGKMISAEDRPAIDRSDFHTVKAGETLGTIAKRYYKNPKLYEAIVKANPDLIKNPDKIEIGWKLKIPKGTFEKGES